MCHELGLGTVRDSDEAVAWYSLAADSFSEASFRVGLIFHADSKHGSTKAVKWYSAITIYAEPRLLEGRPMVQRHNYIRQATASPRPSNGTAP